MSLIFTYKISVFVSDGIVQQTDRQKSPQINTYILCIHLINRQAVLSIQAARNLNTPNRRNKAMKK